MGEFLVVTTGPIVRLLSFLGVDLLLSVFIALALVVVVVLAAVDLVLVLAARRVRAAVGVRNIALVACVFGVSVLVGGAWKSGSVAGAVGLAIVAVLLLAAVRGVSRLLLRFYDKRAESGRV